MEPPWVGGTKVCLRHLGHMTKMAAMPIYGKNTSKSFSPEPAGRFSRFHETWYVASGLQPIIVCSNDDPGVTLSYFTSRSNLVRPKKMSHFKLGWGGQGRCEQRSEVFLKIQILVGGGGGRVVGGVGHEGIRMDVNEELKFL